jgi:hypothetical protein
MLARWIVLILVDGAFGESVLCVDMAPMIGCFFYKLIYCTFLQHVHQPDTQNVLEQRDIFILGQ